MSKTSTYQEIDKISQWIRNNVDPSWAVYRFDTGELGDESIIPVGKKGAIILRMASADPYGGTGNTGYRPFIRVRLTITIYTRDTIRRVKKKPGDEEMAYRAGEMEERIQRLIAGCCGHRDDCLCHCTAIWDGSVPTPFGGGAIYGLQSSYFLQYPNGALRNTGCASSD